MAMDKDSMKTKIKAAYNSRTGLAMSEGDFQAIVDVCQGIIEEIIAGAVVTVTVTGVTPGVGTAPGTGGVTA